MSPVANVAYVTLEAGGQILKFDTTSYAQTGSAAIGLNARHLSISGDGARLYVSRYVTPPHCPGEGTATVTPTAGTGGEVLQLDATSLGLVRTIVLQHSDKVDGEAQGRGIPNYLGAAVISPDGSQAYVPSKQDNVKRGALRDGTGLNFQNTVRAISSRIDLAANSEDLASRIDHDNASVATAACLRAAWRLPVRRPRDRAARWRCSMRSRARSCCASTSAARRRASRSRPTG